MNQLNAICLEGITALNRHSVQSDRADVLADIYQDEVNISIWQRALSPTLVAAAENVLTLNHAFQFSALVEEQDAFNALYTALGRNSGAQLIATDVAEIVAMFCCLFDLKQVGLRLTALDRAMCPKFHVDRVPCRLVSTYSAIATEWLSHQDVDRGKLGMGSEGKSDEESGLYPTKPLLIGSIRVTSAY